LDAYLVAMADIEAHLKAEGLKPCHLDVISGGLLKATNDRGT
jgi:hypothetical protein